MDIQSATTQIKSLIGQAQDKIDSLNVALSLLENGYQSDQAAIAAQVQAIVTPIQASLTNAVNTASNVSIPEQAQTAEQ